MKIALGFLGPPALDYGTRLSRLRWRRAMGAAGRDLAPQENARDVLEGAELWIIVREPSALPAGGNGAPAAPDAGRVLLGPVATPAGGVAVHTLRELEFAPLEHCTGPPLEAPALAFRTSEFPPFSQERLSDFVSRLLEERSVHQWSQRLAAVRLDDPSERERPEILAALPAGVATLLDVGCGAAATSAAFRASSAATIVTGIERDPVLAERAGARLHRVLCGDAIELLGRLLRQGESFDGFLFADVLEHLEDPVSALSLARAVASPGAMLVLSVPNVGHLSVVRDLVAGRFDPVPSGLLDAGHLRWFTSASVRELLEESGWRVSSIESIRAPAPGASDFLAHFSGWEGLDRESLTTYQWLAVARASGRGTRGGVSS